MVVARFMNEPDTLREIGFPVPWDPEHFLRVMAARRARRAKLYRDDAFTIRADNRLHRPKPQYQVEDVFNPLWRDRREMRPQAGESLASYHARLGDYHGMGGGFVLSWIERTAMPNPARDLNWGSPPFFFSGCVELRFNHAATVPPRRRGSVRGDL